MTYNESLTKIFNTIISKIGYNAKQMYIDLNDNNDYDLNVIQFLKQVRIPEPGQKEPIPFKFNIANYFEAKLFAENVSIWKSLTRQNYSTMNHLCLLIYDLIYNKRPGFIITKTKEDYRLLISKIEYIIEHLPEDITLYTFVNKDNIRNYFDYIKLESEQQAWQLVDIAKEQRRNIMIDDAEFIPYVNSIVSRIMIEDYSYSTPTVKLLASSTINDNADKNLINTLDHLYDIKEDDNFILNTLFGNQCFSYNLAKIHYNYRDLGLGEEYAEYMKKLLNNDEDIFRREVLLERKSEEE